MFPYGRQTIEQDDIEAVATVLQSDFLTTGPMVAQFEKKLQDVIGAKHVIAVANGTVALHLACLALGIGKGDGVIVPSITFLATANAPRYCGAEIIFADVDSATGLLTKDSFEKALQKAKEKNILVKAVMPVHLAGQPVDLKAIKEVADSQNIKILTDACHALGTVYGGYSVGSCQYEDLASYSFHPVKTIALGEGGAITTNNDEWAKKIRTARHHGMTFTPEKGPWCYEMQDLGYNYRLTDIQCALGVSQINKLDRFLTKRQEYVDLYDTLLADLSPVLKVPHRVSQEKMGWHLYALRIDFKRVGLSRTQVMEKLKDKGIGTQVHYIPVHTQPYYKKLYGEQDLPGAEAYYQSTLSIPLYPTLTRENVSYIADQLHSILCAGR